MFNTIIRKDLNKQINLSIPVMQFEIIGAERQTHALCVMEIVFIVRCSAGFGHISYVLDVLFTGCPPPLCYLRISG